ncbi:MAG TPA: hypothetical protein PK156_04380 [Polyangium sp.]|nr:hypothetical protein [Polyangium sp.]
MTREPVGIGCPKCGEDMVSAVAEGCARTGQLWKCTACIGMWLDQTACEILLDEDLADEVRAFIRGSRAANPPPANAAPTAPPAAGYRVSARRTGDGRVRCMQCGQEPLMYETSQARHGVRLKLDVCRGHGTWFDRGEAPQFLMAVELRRYGSHGPVLDQGLQPWPDDRPEPKPAIAGHGHHGEITAKPAPKASAPNPEFFASLVEDKPLPAPPVPTVPKPAVNNPDAEWQTFMNTIFRSVEKS